MPPRRGRRLIRIVRTGGAGSHAHAALRTSGSGFELGFRNDLAALFGGRLDVSERVRDIARGGKRHARELLAARAKDAFLRAPHADRGNHVAAAITDRDGDPAHPDQELAAIDRVAASSRLLEISLDVAPGEQRERREAFDMLPSL